MNQEASLAEFLAKAIDSDNLMLFVQPQISISTGMIIGGEVLLRVPSYLEDDYKGSHEGDKSHTISPIPVYAWIQTALSQGLINPLSEWIASNVIKQLSLKGGSRAKNIPISVNMPPEIINGEFCNFIASTFEKFPNVSPSQVSIEITEFPKANNLQFLNKHIQTLRAMGMKVIIDDFGSGYATMNYLVDLNVDAVKIDQKFVQKAPLSPSAMAVLKCLIDLAQEIHLEVICEGVETVEQRSIVERLKCDVIQGFLVSKPMPFDEFWEAVEKSTPPILH